MHFYDFPFEFVGVIFGIFGLGAHYYIDWKQTHRGVKGARLLVLNPSEGTAPGINLILLMHGVYN